MKLVVDTNVVLASLLRDGPVRRTLATTGATLYAPMFLRDEISKYLGKIARRAGVKKADLEPVMTALLAGVRWVGDPAIEKSWHQAERAIGARDHKDVAYLACALAIEADAIWSFDTDFDAQELIPRVTSPDELDDP